MSEISRTKREIRKEIRDRMKEKTPEGVYPELQMSSEDYFKLHTNHLFYLDKIQVAIFNQTRAAFTNSIIFEHPLYPQIQELRRTENKGNKEEVKKKKTRIAKLVKKALSEFLKMKGSDAEKYITSLAHDEFDTSYEGQAFEIAEQGLVKKVEPYLEQQPIYTGFMKKVDGLGVKTSAKLLAILKDLTRFPTPSSLWHYCGLHVEIDSETGIGSAEEREKEKMLTSNPKAKSLLIGVIGPNLLKQNSPYRKLYDERSARTKLTHPEWWHLNPDGTPSKEKNMHPKHGYNDAVRVMVKRFLVELWRAGYLAKGLQPPCNVYILNNPNHHLDPDIVPFASQVKTETQIPFAKPSSG